MSIYISGSLAYDRIMNFPDKFSNHILPDKLHILNVCFLVQDLEERFGGTAGNMPIPWPCWRKKLPFWPLRAVILNAISTGWTNMG